MNAPVGQAHRRSQAEIHHPRQQGIRLAQAAERPCLPGQGIRPGHRPARLRLRARRQPIQEGPMILTAIIGGVFVIPAIIIACMAPFAPECPEGCDDCGRHR